MKVRMSHATGDLLFRKAHTGLFMNTDSASTNQTFILLLTYPPSPSPLVQTFAEPW